MDFFKAYDVRGRVPDELNPDLAKRIGNAFAVEFGLKTCCIGRDVRLSGPDLCRALSQGLRDAGVTVTDLGICGSEEVYYASFAAGSVSKEPTSPASDTENEPGFDGGIVVTASHNPSEYNGFKFVRRGAVPVSGDSGLFTMRDRVASGSYRDAPEHGDYRQAGFRQEYIRHLLGSVDVPRLAPLKILADPGHGCAGPVLDLLAAELPFQFVFIHKEMDGTFPSGVPNPLLPENREATAEAVRRSGADLGLAWDGDFDRCFFYDAQGNFIEGYYIVGLLAQSLLARESATGRDKVEKIIHDPRLTWNTIELTERSGGLPLEGKTGHAFMKERMRAENALYGGEMSAHHYFRDFSYCDSGMIPWLLVAELMSRTGKSLASLVEGRITAYPCSGEINRKVKDAGAIMAAVKKHFAPQALKVSEPDGISLEFARWRFNLRSSNTEPLLRLNVETRGDSELMRERTSQLLQFIDHYED